MHSWGPSEIAKRIGVFCLLIALVLGLTADSILGRAGLYVAFVPQFFRSKILPAASRAEMVSGHQEAAVSTARAAVLEQPLSVEALAVLAQSTVVSEPRMSSDALTHAAGLGWRDVAVQASIIESVSLTKRWDIVAPRLLALANLNALEAVDPAVFANEETPDYAPKIAPAFADNGIAWFKFTKWLRDKGLERQSEALLAQTPEYEREDACSRLGLTASEFVRAGRVEFAAELVDTRCRNFLTSTSSALTISENFGDPIRGPFEWQVVSLSGIIVRTDTKDGMTVAEVDNSDPLPRIIAQKIVRASVLQPESVVYYKEIIPGGLRQKMLPLKFECVTARLNLNAKADSDSSMRSLGNCTFFRVSFQLNSGHFEIWSGDFSRTKSTRAEPKSS